MVENDRIPKPLFDDFLARCNVLEHRLVPVVGSFETWALEAEPEAIVRRLENDLAECRKNLGRRDQLIDVSLPDSAEIKTMVKLVGPALAELKEAKGEARDALLAEVFGAALRAVVRKRGDPGIRSPSMFRRRPILSDDVLVDVPALPDVSISLDRLLMPDISEEQAAELRRHFPPERWTFYREADGQHSMLNGGAEQEIILPQREDDAVLIMRFYCAARNDPYWVQIVVDERPVEEHAIYSGETRLSKIHVPQSATSIKLVTRHEDGRLLSLPHHVHVAVCKLVPFWCPSGFSKRI
jgi:hypothetical protein